MLSREQALKILSDHLKNKNLINHCKAVEASMKALAKKLDGDVEKWGLTGLLHDADWEETQSDPSQHTAKTIEWIKAAGEIDQEIIDCILTHNFENNGFRAPESLMEWSLFICDELTGFIVAVALVRPEKKLALVTEKSVLKKFPMTAFAKPVNREQIKLCEKKLGIPLEVFVKIILESMQDIAPDLGL